MTQDQKTERLATLLRWMRANEDVVGHWIVFKVYNEFIDACYPHDHFGDYETARFLMSYIKAYQKAHGLYGSEDFAPDEKLDGNGIYDLYGNYIGTTQPPGRMYLSRDEVSELLATANDPILEENTELREWLEKDPVQRKLIIEPWLERKRKKEAAGHTTE